MFPLNCMCEQLQTATPHSTHGCTMHTHYISTFIPSFPPQISQQTGHSAHSFSSVIKGAHSVFLLQFELYIDTYTLTVTTDVKVPTVQTLVQFTSPVMHELKAQTISSILSFFFFNRNPSRFIVRLIAMPLTKRLLFGNLWRVTSFDECRVTRQPLYCFVDDPVHSLLFAFVHELFSEMPQRCVAMHRSHPGKQLFAKPKEKCQST